MPIAPLYQQPASMVFEIEGFHIRCTTRYTVVAVREMVKKGSVWLAQGHFVESWDGTDEEGQPVPFDVDLLTRPIHDALMKAWTEEVLKIVGPLPSPSSSTPTPTDNTETNTATE